MLLQFTEEIFKKGILKEFKKNRKECCRKFWTQIIWKILNENVEEFESTLYNGFKKKIKVTETNSKIKRENLKNQKYLFKEIAKEILSRLPETSPNEIFKYLLQKK